MPPRDDFGHAINTVTVEDSRIILVCAAPVLATEEPDVELGRRVVDLLARWSDRNAVLLGVAAVAKAPARGRRAGLDDARPGSPPPGARPRRPRA